MLWTGTLALGLGCASSLPVAITLPAEARDRGSWGHHGVFYQLPDGSINWLLYCEHGAARATDLDAA